MLEFIRFYYEKFYFICDRNYGFLKMTRTNKQAAIFIFLTLAANFLFAQKQKAPVNAYAAIDKKALLLPDSLTRSTDGIAAYVSSNFNTDIDKARAIYTWIATNIEYDVQNMFAINFYEKPDEKIKKVLATRKGICENFALLFHEVCTKCNIRSYVIEGYTKQNGFADYIPHAWCAALIDTSWYIFDPTWGSGYVQNGRFVKKLSNAYFKVNPEVIVKTHMPFDYLWQFLYYPVTNQEFYEGKVQLNKSKPFFNFNDSIKQHESLNHIAQLTASADRIERNGVKNSMIFDRLQHIKMEIENDRQNTIQTLFNTAVNDYNAGINSYNDFINYRNKQFTPHKPDAEIQAMLDDADHGLKSAKDKVLSIKNPDANQATSIVQLRKSVDDAQANLKEQQDWLKTYFSKGKAGRKSMFYDRKVTWFGIPIN